MLLWYSVCTKIHVFIPKQKRELTGGARIDAISKFDANDPTSMPIELRSLVDVHDQELAARWNTDDLTGLRVGVPKEYYVEPISEDVVRVWRDGIRQLRKQGATIVPISLPHTKYALSTYYTIALAEASSNLARYDGVRYGSVDINQFACQDFFPFNNSPRSSK